MLSSMPGVAQLHSCHLAHIHDHRVFHPFQSLAITSRRCQHWRSPVLSRRQTCQNRRCSLLIVQAVAHGEASELVAKGQKKYDSGDRMGALKLWEQALSRDPTVEDRQAALFNSTCVHASFGDVEFAQVTLRDAINCGLDFEDAMRSSDYVKLNSSPQVIIQLRKFAQAAKRIKDAVGTEASAPRLAKAVTKGEIKPGDLSDILGTEIRDGMDTSAFGILRRVLIIILVAVVGGTALFFLGLKFAFPEYR
ncbi:hypothetical protein ABBQ32_012853 [Trebouxia sp. C0010 RCD-2024]